jgi:type I restriction enzyme S subunit
MQMRVKLKDIFDLQMGKTPSRSNLEYWNTTDYKWISIADLTKTSKYIFETKEYLSKSAIKDSGIKVIPANTVVMSFKLSIGKTAITKEDMYSNEAIMAFKDKHVINIIPEYIFYLFKYKNWEECSNKAVMGKTLNKATLSEIEVEICSIEKQRQIVNILDKIMSAVDGRKQELQLLDELIKARFVEMFGDPVANDKGWKMKPLLDMGKCKNGMNFHYDDSGVEISCLGVGDFKDLSVIDNTKKLSIVSLNEMPSEEYLLKDGDIVFVRSNGNKDLVGRSLAIYPGKLPTTFSGFCIRYRIHDDEITVPYLLRVLKMESMRKKMAGRGANIQNLNQQILGTLVIPVPPIELQNQFVDFVRAIDKSKVAVQKALDETQILFDSLMQKYFG